MLAAAAGVAAAVAGCSRAPAPSPPSPPEVSVVVLAAAPVTLTRDLTGRVAPTVSSEVRPQVDGIVRQRLFDEGSLVRAGQPLYVIDSRAFTVSLHSAQAQLDSATAAALASQAKADRYASLRGNQAISRQVIDDTVAAAGAAQASVRQYRAAVEGARLNLDYSRVRAPISGRIGRSTVTSGALVTANQATPLAVIQQLDPLYVDVTQSSAQLLDLRQSLARGQVMPSRAEVRLKLENGSVYRHPGVIEFSEAQVDPNTDTVTLRARFPNPEGLLLPGMFVRVGVAQAMLSNGILAPQQGIARGVKGSASALVVDGRNHVVKRDVTLGQAIGTDWLVTGGLRSGDRLIVEGTDRVAAGDTVKPVPFRPGR